MTEETIVYQGDAQWHRPAYLKLVGNQVVFDCSDGEYGPIKFDIETLKWALFAHEIQDDAEWGGDDISDWDETLMDGLDDV
jgi:hypothetical protein